jgi:hypothetical protein
VSERLNDFDTELLQSWRLCTDWINAQLEVPPQIESTRLTQPQEELVRIRHKQLLGGCWVAPSPATTDFTVGIFPEELLAVNILILLSKLPDQLEGQIADGLSRGSVRFVRRQGTTDTSQSTFVSLASDPTTWGTAMIQSTRGNVSQEPEAQSQSDIFEADLGGSPDSRYSVPQALVPNNEWSTSKFATFSPLTNGPDQSNTSSAGGMHVSLVTDSNADLGISRSERSREVRHVSFIEMYMLFT